MMSVEAPSEPEDEDEDGPYFLEQLLAVQADAARLVHTEAPAKVCRRFYKRMCTRLEDASYGLAHERGLPIRKRIDKTHDFQSFVILVNSLVTAHMN
jgi:hypothetical protein